MKIKLYETTPTQKLINLEKDSKNTQIPDKEGIYKMLLNQLQLYLTKKIPYLNKYRYLNYHQRYIAQYQGSALAEPGGSWHLTFVLRRLENLSFFIEIICWAPWIWLPSIFLRAQPWIPSRNGTLFKALTFRDGHCLKIPKFKWMRKTYCSTIMQN